MGNIAGLPDRGVIELAGEDRVAFLQGLVSNDVEASAPGRAVWTGLLSPQGKYFADFFVFGEPDRLLLDCEAAQIPILVPKLSRYRLRAKVTLRTASEYAVYVGWNDATPISGAAPDPRLPNAGWRAIAAPGALTNATPEDWDLHRLALGLPDGSRDLELDKTLLLEAGFDELNGLSWTKGCYMGQELTARTKYRGLLKRRLVPVAIVGPLAPPGTAILRDGAEVGTMRSGRDGIGLAVIRLDSFAGPLTAGSAVLHARPAAWMRLPEPA